MTIQSEIRKAGPYLGNGSNTLFTFPFKIFKAQDLLVVYTDPAGIERTLTLGTDYTAALNPDQDSAAGGSITTLFVPPAGYLVTMTSNVPNLQEVVFTNSGGFYPVLLTKTLDKLTILVQQLALDVSRAVKVTLSTEKTPDQLLDSIYASALEADKAEAEAKAAALSAQAFAQDTTTWIRNQTKTMASPTPGTAPNFVISNAEPYTQILDGTRINVFFAEEGATGFNTLTLDGFTGNLVQLNGNGIEVPAIVTSGMFADIIATSYRGTIKYHILNQSPPAPSRAIITQTGPWTIPKRWRGQPARVSLIGGGGGGGAGAAGSDIGSGGGGGGGGAGVWSTLDIVIPIGLGTLYAVIGQGGAGGQLGGYRGGDGAVGSSTTLFDKQQEPRATLATSPGGSPGGGAGGDTSNAAMYPGTGGGNGSGGDGSGISVATNRCPPGNGGVGGTSFYAAGGRSGARAGTPGVPGFAGGPAASNSGAGGGGGGGGLGLLPASIDTAGGVGGAGSSGLIIIDLLG